MKKISKVSKSSKTDTDVFTAWTYMVDGFYIRQLKLNYDCKWHLMALK